VTRAELAVLGIGNPIAGDDGVGPFVVRRLREQWGERPDLIMEEIVGDLFAISDLLPRAEHFVLVDAIVGNQPGRVVIMSSAPRAFAPSLHQCDVASVMGALAALGDATSFPTWEIWGVEVALPTELGFGLSPEAERGAQALVELLNGLIVKRLGDLHSAKR
jgi:hydrogenase maturation protease